MKKVMTLLMAAMLVMPLTLTAQDEDDFGFFGHDDMGQMDQMPPAMHGGGGGRSGMGHLMAMGDELGLTDDQRNQIKKMMVDHKLAQIDRRAELQKAKVQLHVLMQDDDASESAVNSQIDKLSDLRGDMQKGNYSHRKSLHAILTAEQLEKIKELKKAGGKRAGMFGKAGRKFEQAKQQFGRQTQRAGRGSSCERSCCRH